MRAAAILRMTRRFVAPFFVVLAATGTASASVVERVVAVVGEQALLLSELRERAKPFLMQLGQQAEDEAHRAAATSQLYARLLQRMVEDELEQKAANRANLTVTAAESRSIYGPLAAPIAVLLWLYLLALSVLIGAAVNAAFDTVFPQQSTTRARRELVQRLRERMSVRDS